MINFMKFKQEQEMQKKQELLQSKFFKILEKENKKEKEKLINFLLDKTSDEIEDVIKYIIKQKSVQKQS